MQKRLRADAPVAGNSDEDNDEDGRAAPPAAGEQARTSCAQR